MGAKKTKATRGPKKPNRRPSDPKLHAAGRGGQTRTNRIGASRLQQISDILQVPAAFFFEGAPHLAGIPAPAEFDEAPSPAYVAKACARPRGASTAWPEGPFPAIKSLADIVAAHDGLWQ
jgi:hypothetical protein